MIFSRERLKECRADAGMSQEKVAHAVGVSLSAVRSWERGTNVPSANAVGALATVLELDRLEALYASA